MTPLDTSICWAVLAPLAIEELERIAAREWARDMPGAIDPPPWQAVAGEAGFNALVSRSPGTEGSDRHFAEILSSLAPGHSVYSLWLDPERQHAFAWKEGAETGTPQATPDEIASRAGFRIAPVTAPPAPDMSAAFVEGASLDAVRAALGEFADEPWLQVEQGTGGVVITATDGPLGTQAWDVAEALPAATVYFVQQGTGLFEVLVLRGQEQAGSFRIPPLEGEPAALADIKGERLPLAIMRALGIAR
jgi:hypothetical protein